MPRKVVFPFLQKRLSSSTVAARRKAVRVFGAPPTIAAIPEQGEPMGNAGAYIRQIGSTRRIFLLQPYLKANEMEGLAYRIRTLTRNDAIASIFIASDNSDDVAMGALPSSLRNREPEEEPSFLGFPPSPGYTWHVTGGYDPLQLYRSGKHKDPEAVDYLLRNMSDLAKACRGDSEKTKIPVITALHGAITDGGFAFGASSYVLATSETRFRILNPSRGLTLDPVGLSYILPRLGKEFDQPSAEYPGCGIILGCMGFEADDDDMVETGLATSHIDSAASIGLLEDALSVLRPWKQQALIKEPMRFYGDPLPTTDHNAQFRNVQVADTVNCFSSYRADRCDVWYNNIDYDLDDPSLDPDPVPFTEDISSDLVNFAATFNDIFKREKTLVGILESLREASHVETTDPEEQQARDAAADLVERLERQSPLAVSVTFRLLQLGADSKQTWESCMARERRAQAALLSMPDFEQWAKYALKKGDDATTVTDFSGWKHEKIANVSKDEVEEIIGNDKTEA